MELTDTCPCGAQITIKTNESYNAGTRHLAWLEAHRACREKKPPTPEFPTIELKADEGE